MRQTYRLWRQRTGRSKLDPLLTHSAAGNIIQYPEVGNQETELPSETPAAPTPELLTTQALITFALPTLILPLADPVMSLIDTVCIGNFGTVVELAATGPASLLFGAASSLFSALTSTALSDMSAYLSTSDTASAAEAFGSALKAALIAGVFVAVVFNVGSLQLVSALGVAPDVVPVAAQYLAIRSLAAPAAKGTAVCAAALMAQRDSRSPAVVVFLSATCNLIADVVCIAVFHLGLPGAAISTVVTQYLTLTALVTVCLQPGRILPTWGPAATPSTPPAPNGDGNGSRGTAAQEGGAAAPPPAGAGDDPSRDAAVKQAALELLSSAVEITPLMLAAPRARALLSGDATASSSGTESGSDVDDWGNSTGSWDFEMRLSPEQEELVSAVAEGPDVVQAKTFLAAGESELLAQTQFPPQPAPEPSPAEDAEGDVAAVAVGIAAATPPQVTATPQAVAAPSATSAPPAAPAAAKTSSSANRGAMLAAVYAAKLICYFMVQGSAMRLAVAELAAHNAMFSLWNVCAYFPVPLQTTALAFVPRCSCPEARTQVTKQLLFASVFLAIPLAALCTAIPVLFPSAITTDSAVSSHLLRLAPYASLSIFLCTLDVACEGLLVAQQRLRLLLVSMSTVLCVVAMYFWGGCGQGLAGTWLGLIVFFGPRCVVSITAVVAGMRADNAQVIDDVADTSKGDLKAA